MTFMPHIILLQEYNVKRASEAPLNAGYEIREIGLGAAGTGAGLAAHLVRQGVKLPHGRKSSGVSDARHCDAKADNTATDANMTVFIIYLLGGLYNNCHSRAHDKRNVAMRL